MSALTDGIETLLTTDTQFVAALHALTLGKNSEAKTPKVLKSMRPVASIGQEHYPCWVMEVGDTTTTERAVGSCHQGAQREYLLALVWHQKNPDLAFDQMNGLWDPLVALFLRNPLVAEAGVVVDAQATDRAASHPTHITTFRLLADVQTNP